MILPSAWQLLWQNIDDTSNARNTPHTPTSQTSSYYLRKISRVVPAPNLYFRGSQLQLIAPYRRIYASVNWVHVIAGRLFGAKQVITWINADLLPIELQGANVDEIWIKVRKLSLKKINLKTSENNESGLIPITWHIPQTNPFLGYNTEYRKMICFTCAVPSTSEYPEGHNRCQRNTVKI